MVRSVSVQYETSGHYERNLMTILERAKVFRFARVRLCPRFYLNKAIIAGETASLIFIG